MPVKLNRAGYDRARELVSRRCVVTDDRDAWSEHRPPTARENQYLAECGYHEYSRWHLGIDTDRPPDTKSHYKFPYGDFERIHRCAVLSAEVRAGQRNYHDIQAASAHLHGMIDALTT